MRESGEKRENEREVTILQTTFCKIVYVSSIILFVKHRKRLMLNRIFHQT